MTPGRFARGNCRRYYTAEFKRLPAGLRDLPIHERLQPFLIAREAGMNMFFQIFKELTGLRALPGILRITRGLAAEHSAVVSSLPHHMAINTAGRDSMALRSAPSRHPRGPLCLRLRLEQPVPVVALIAEQHRSGYGGIELDPHTITIRLDPRRRRQSMQRAFARHRL